MVTRFSLPIKFGNPLWKLIDEERSPVILSRHDQRAWINPGHVSLGVSQCIKPINYKEFNAYPIGTAINIKVQTNKGIRLINPIGTKLLVEDHERWARAYRDIQAPWSGRN